MRAAGKRTGAERTDDRASDVEQSQEQEQERRRDREWSG